MRSEQGQDGTRGPIVRPYALTGGRTRPTMVQELEIEALISTTASGGASLTQLSVEWRQIALLCREVLSVAEVAARLGFNLGVARVLIGDMANAGFLALHRPTSPGERPDLALLERVLNGLRSL